MLRSGRECKSSGVPPGTGFGRAIEMSGADGSPFDLGMDLGCRHRRSRPITLRGDWCTGPSRLALSWRGPVTKNCASDPGISHYVRVHPAAIVIAIMTNAIPVRGWGSGRNDHFHVTQLPCRLPR